MAQTIQIRRGTGSAVPASLAEGELAINVDTGKLYFGETSTSASSNFRFENLTAENYTVTSSVTHYAFQTLSGSSDFGDDSGDIHNRTGSLNVSGALSMDGDIELSNNGEIFVGSSGTRIIANNDDYWKINANGVEAARFSSAGVTINEGGQPSVDFRVESNSDTHLLFVDSGANKMAIGTNTVSDSLLTVDGDIKATNITSSGDISASGDIFCDDLTIGDQLDIGDDIRMASSTAGIFFDATGEEYTFGIGQGGLVMNAGTTNPASVSHFIVSASGLTSLNASARVAIGGTPDTTNMLTVYGNISSSGDLLATDLSLGGTSRISSTVGTIQINDHIYVTSGQHITASGNISSSGTIIAATLDASAVSDTLAAAIVAEIDNDEIPIAKLAEDAVTINSGTNLSGGGSVTLGGAITLNVDDAFLKNNADDTTSGKLTTVGLNSTSHITASGNISSSGTITAEHFYSSDDAEIQDALTVNGDINANGSIVGDGNTSLTGIKHITTVGTISSSGNITSSGIFVAGNVDISQNLYASRIYPNGSSGPFIDQLGPNLQFSTGISILSNITASGDISSSGTIFTDTLSSPGNNLSIPSNTVTITAGTAGDANLILQSDTDDSEEADNPFMLLEQDGGAIRSIIGHAGANDEYPDATVFTGGLSNHLIIAHSGSGASRGMQFGTGNNARVTINTDGEVGIGNNVPVKTLDVTGEIRASSTITATSLAINTDGAGKANIISSQQADLKIATTHASSNRDVGIELSGSGALYSLALDRANDTFVIAPSAVATAPGSAAFTLSATTASFSGQVIDGGRTLVKILPTDFVANDGGRPVQIEDDSIGSNELFLHSHSDFDMYAYIEIPFGMTATHVKIFGSNTGENFTVYEANINTKTIASKCSATAVNSLADITDVPSTETNYLVILVTSDGATDEIHGGFVTITPS